MPHKTLKLAAHLLCQKKRRLCVVLGGCCRLGRINALFGKLSAFFGSVTALLGIVNAFLGKLSALSRQNGAVSLRSHHPTATTRQIQWIPNSNPLDSKLKSIGFQNQIHWILCQT